MKAPSAQGNGRRPSLSRTRCCISVHHCLNTNGLDRGPGTSNVFRHTVAVATLVALGVAAVVIALHSAHLDAEHSAMRVLEVRSRERVRVLLGGVDAALSGEFNELAQARRRRLMCRHVLRCILRGLLVLVSRD
jgi:hypothetical protein